MSELKEHQFCECDEIIREYRGELSNEMHPYYLKSEADKVIAEKDSEIRRLENLCESYRIDCDNIAIREANTYKEIERDNKQLRRHKYKRCLAMAKWCESTSLWCYQAACTLPKGLHATLHGKPVMIEPTRLFKRHELLTKWNTRWLELAEKFKEDK